jgi:hypothetical protein
MTEPASQPDSPRWYHPRPGHFVVLLLVVEGVLWLSERYRWFPFNEHKNWTVLIAVAAVGGFLATMFLWFLAALVFRVRFQFSLRSLLLLTVAVAAAFAWLAHEKREVEEIDKMPGVMEYDFQVDASRKGRKAIPAGPPWLRRILGDHFFAEVIDLDLSGTQVTDAGLEHLKGLTQLWRLSLNGTEVTDVGLEHLKGLMQLQGLYLTRTKVTDAGLEHLKGLTQLRVLRLSGTQVADAGLEHLKGLTQLERLDLSGTRVSGAGLEHLKGLTQLWRLSLDGTEVTDAGLEHLKGLTQLSELNLGGTNVTNAGKDEFWQTKKREDDTWRFEL